MNPRGGVRVYAYTTPLRTPTGVPTYCYTAQDNCCDKDPRSEAMWLSLLPGGITHCDGLSAPGGVVYAYTRTRPLAMWKGLDQ